MDAVYEGKFKSILMSLSLEAIFYFDSYLKINFGFLMFSGGIKRKNEEEMG